MSSLNYQPNLRAPLGAREFSAHRTMIGEFVDYRIQQWRRFFGFVDRSAPPHEEEVAKAIREAFTCLEEGYEPQGFGDGIGKLRDAIISVIGLGSTSGVPEEMRSSADTSIAELDKSGYTTLEAFRWFVENWTKAKDAPIFAHFTNLLGIAIATGFAPDEWSEVHVNSVQIWRLDHISRYSDIVVMLDGVIMAANYFVESVIASWEVGDLSPFLYEKTTSRRLDKMFEDVQNLVPKIKSGQYYRDGGKWGTAMTQIDMAMRVYRGAVDMAPALSLQRKIFQDRVVRLTQWSLEMSISKRGAVMVQQPFAAVVFGLPGCGKSGVMIDLQKLRAAQSGFEYQPSMTAKMVQDEQFHSQVLNSTMFLVYDDLCNRPLKYDKSLGVAGMLQTVNNSAYVAVKAELELKGIVIPELLMVVGSTNVRDLGIHLISKCPDSLRRRYLLIDMEVIPEYANSQGGFDSVAFENNPQYCGSNGEHADYARFTINSGVKDGHSPIEYSLSNGESVTLQDLSYDRFLFWMERLMNKHDKIQKDHVTRSNKRVFTKCLKCGSVVCRCTRDTVDDDDDVPCLLTRSDCDIDDDDDSSCSSEEDEELEIEDQGMFSDMVAGFALKTAKSALSERLGDLPLFYNMFEYILPNRRIQRTVCSVLIDHINLADYLQWWYWIPQDAWEWDIFKKIAPVLRDVEINRRIVRSRRYSVSAFACIPLLYGLFHFEQTSPEFTFATISLFGFSWLYHGTQLIALRRSAYQCLSEKKDMVAQFAKDSQSRWSPHMIRMYEMSTRLGAMLGAGFAAHQLWNNLSFGPLEPKAVPVSTPLPKQQIPPTPLDDFPKKEPSAEDVEYTKSLIPLEVEKQGLVDVSEGALVQRNEVKNAWQQRVVTAKLTYRNPNMTHEQLVAIVEGNLSAIFWKRDGAEEAYNCNVLWIDTDLCLMAASDLPTKPVKARICDKFGRSASVERTISPADFYLRKGHKFAVGYIKYRSKRNIIPYFNKEPGTLKASFHLRLPEGNLMESFDCEGSFLDLGDNDCPQIAWKWPFENARGCCGGAYVSYGKNPAIVGVHFGGVLPSRMEGVSRSFSAQELGEYLNEIVRSPLALPGSSAPEVWNPFVNGKKTFTLEEIGDPDLVKSAYWLQDAVIIEKQGAITKGSFPSSAFYKSRAVDTLISDSIKELCPEDLRFGPPRFGRGMWAKSVTHSISPSPGLPTEHLEWAVRDYMEAFQWISPYLRSNLKPLSWDEVLNGIDGVRFIDAMNWNTSMGIGFQGGKKAWITEYIDGSGHERKRFKEEIWTQVKFALSQLEKGERVPWIFNAVPKDEPTPVEKEKVRLFMVAEIACTLLVRKYYTPVCRALQMTTGISECAVGLNSASADWDSLWKHFGKFNNVFDGDYSKYDLKKSPAISSASYRIMLDIAALGHYTSEDLYIMSMISNDLLFPLVNYNGTVLAMDGLTPSGIPVTVIINGLDNSLMNRAAYKSVYPKAKVGEFRRYVAHANYGDDFINSVSWWRRDFNFLSMQKYLADHGTKITPGIKDSEGKRFVRSLDDLVFLQRTNQRLPELPFSVGKLAEKSIWKSLLCVLKPKQDYAPDLASAINVDGALREWVYHGETHYEMRRVQMIEILEKHRIRHLSMVCDLSYHDLLKHLQEDHYGLPT